MVPKQNGIQTLLPADSSPIPIPSPCLSWSSCSYVKMPRDSRNNWPCSRGLYLDSYSIKERDLYIIKLSRSLVWVMASWAWVLNISPTSSACRQTLEIQDHSHLCAFTLTLEHLFHYVPCTKLLITGSLLYPHLL